MAARAEPLRVLLVHNAYQQRGGEDAVFESERDLLREHGHEVACYTRHNDEVADTPVWTLARDTVWSPRTTAEIVPLLAQFRPDVVHVHNSFPLISPSLHAAVRQAGLPLVQTLHNFRLLCPQAMLLRDGRVCEDCVGRVPWRAVQHRCYRESAAQSAALAGMLQWHRVRGTWQHDVTLYIALNQFCRDKFVQGGLPAERLRIKPNFVADPGLPQTADRDGWLFVGRLSPEKGVATLAQAMTLPGAAGTTLRVAGAGPEQASLQGLPGVQTLGPLAADCVQAEMRRARALVLPSICYENMPRTLVEAAACGLPTIASRLGALPELVADGETGLLFEAGNPVDLATKLNWAQAHPAEMARMGQAARRRFEQAWGAEANHQQLLAVYQEARLMVRREATPA